MAEENCTHDCSSCDKNCEERDFHIGLNKKSSVKKTIAIISGKGGVGKSLVTSLLACKVNRDGFKTAILDADITGPSIPESFGISDKRATSSDESTLDPVITDKGIQIMSMNLLLPNENDPVLWRGPMITGIVKQFYSEVVWKDVDFMFVDMPPGTGDVPLTVFQSIPIDGIIVVTSPQQLVRVIVEKALKMANIMSIPILGLVENMSYVKCPCCQKEITIFGKSNIEQIASSFSLPILAKIPIQEATSIAVDSGDIENLSVPYLDSCAKMIEDLLQ